MTKELNIEQERRAFVAAAEIEFRNDESFTKRDFSVGLRTWLAAKRAAVGSAEPVAFAEKLTSRNQYDTAVADALGDDRTSLYAPPAPVSAEPVKNADEALILCAFQNAIRNIEYISKGVYPGKDFDLDGSLVTANIKHAKRLADFVLPNLRQAHSLVGKLLVSAPPATDAKDRGYELPERKLEYVSPLCPDYPSEDSFNEGYIDGWNDCIDAAIAAKGQP